MKQVWLKMTLVSVLGLGSAWVLAEDVTSDNGNNVQVYGNLGLSGVDVGVGYGVNEHFTVRSDIATMGEINKNFNEDEIAYKAKFKNHKVNFLADYFPSSSSGFRLTTGVGLGRTQLEANGSAKYKQSRSFEFGDRHYNINVDSNDSVYADVKYPSVSPYLGIGFGHNIAQKKSGWGFVADLGVYIGAPKHHISVSNSLNDKLVNAQAILDGAGVNVTDEQKAAAQVEVNRRIDIEKKKIQDKIGKYRVIPTLSVGVSYTF